MIETKILCDGCNEPIIGRAGYPKNEYILVKLENIPMPVQESVYAIAMKSKLDRNYHFHNIKCLYQWKKIEEATN